MVTLEGDDPWAGITPAEPERESEPGQGEPERIPLSERDWGPGTDDDRWGRVNTLARKVATSLTARTAIQHGEFADDIASEVVVHVLERSKNTPITPAFVRRATHGIVARASHANRTGIGRENVWSMSSSDMKAWKIHQARVRELEQETGRALNHKELDTVAAQIRDNWPDRKHRPRENFHRQESREASIDAATATGFEYGHAPSAEEESVVSQPEPDGEHMAAALDAIDSDDADGRSRQKERLLHNAIAELRGAPLVVPGAMSQRACTTARREIGTDSAAVLDVCDEWEATAHQGGTERTALLFAPYGDITDEAKWAVVDMYRDVPEYAAGGVYASALMMANARNAPQTVNA